jgi:hypothetical protein
VAAAPTQALSPWSSLHIVNSVILHKHGGLSNINDTHDLNDTKPTSPTYDAFV